MAPKTFPGELFPVHTPEAGTVIVNERVRFRTMEDTRVVCVDGIILHHYRVGDRMAEAYAMVMLAEQRYADQNDIARAFGYATRTMRRYQERFEEGGLQALGKSHGRQLGSRSVGDVNQLRDRTILRLKTGGMSNRVISRKVGLNEKTIRRRLRRLGWTSHDTQRILFEEHSPASIPQKPSDLKGEATTPIQESQNAIGTELHAAEPEEDPVLRSFDDDPLNRSIDRFLAALGFLDDAPPLFAPAISIPRAGVLLAIPALVASGLLSIARDVYGSIGPAFYGLRTTVVAFVLLALIRVKRPEALKEYAPPDLGRIVGLDRAPEVKTLRRKLTRLATMKRAELLGRKLAQRRVTGHGRALGFLYVDGHVRVYHGKRRITKAYVTRLRLAIPATTDYWVNDKRGDPLFVVTAEANAAMTQMLPVVLKEVRTLLGPHRRVTIVFDRGGWSPKLFAKLIDDGFDILTYRKGHVPYVSEKKFIVRKARFDGHSVQYRLNDQPILLLKGKLRLRQVTRLSDNGHQTPIITSRWDLRDIVVAYRMFERWRQENFFKYLREEYALDALVDYHVESDDPSRTVPNPAWKELDKEMKAARLALAKLEKEFGIAAIDNSERKRQTMRGFKIAHGKLGKQIRAERTRVADLMATRASLQRRVPVAEALKGQEVIKLSTERKHLTNILKMVAYQIESDLFNQLRPHYARVEEEGRTLIQAAFQSAASIEPSDQELHVILSPQSSPHRSKAIASLCESVNKTETFFPGTKLRMRYSVAGYPG
jgi:prepilin-type processing-associated H-X9-DG protein